MSKKYYIVEVDEVPDEPIWVINSSWDMSILLPSFTLCSLLLVLCISFQVVDSPIFQNFRHSLLSDTAALSLLVCSGAAEIGLICTLLCSLLRGAKLSKMRPSLTSILISIGIVLCFGYGCYECLNNCDKLKEEGNERHSWFSYTSEQYNRERGHVGAGGYGYDKERYSYVFSHRAEISTLEATSTNLYSYGFCPTYCNITINSDNSAYILLQGEHYSTITLENKAYHIRIGNNGKWQKLPLKAFGPSYCPHSAYYIDNLYDDIMSAGSFSLKVPTNRGELVYHFANR